MKETRTKGKGGGVTREPIFTRNAVHHRGAPSITHVRTPAYISIHPGISLERFPPPCLNVYARSGFESSTYRTVFLLTGTAVGEQKRRKNTCRPLNAFRKTNRDPLLSSPSPPDNTPPRGDDRAHPGNTTIGKIVPMRNPIPYRFCTWFSAREAIRFDFHSGIGKRDATNLATRRSSPRLRSIRFSSDLKYCIPTPRDPRQFRDK